jgi:hypothetical protein
MRRAENEEVADRALFAHPGFRDRLTRFEAEGAIRGAGDFAGARLRSGTVADRCGLTVMVRVDDVNDQDGLQHRCQGRGKPDSSDLPAHDSCSHRGAIHPLFGNQQSPTTGQERPGPAQARNCFTIGN